MMNIVYSSSDSYAEICGISLLSCLDNNRQEDEINVFIVDNNISIDNKKKLTEVCDKYCRKLVFISYIDLNAITHTKVYTGRWNIGTFFRLFLGSLLPKEVERAIYIDCDTIVRNSLHDVYNIDFRIKDNKGVVKYVSAMGRHVETKQYGKICFCFINDITERERRNAMAENERLKQLEMKRLSEFTISANKAKNT